MDADFTSWCEEVEATCGRALGLDTDSIFGDWPSWSLWDAGMSPAEAVLELLQTQGSDALIPEELHREAEAYLAPLAGYVLRSPMTTAEGGPPMP